MKKIIALVLTAFIIASCSSCQSFNRDLDFNETSNTSKIIETGNTSKSLTFKADDINIQKKIALFYEEYFNDNSDDVAIQSNCFKILKKEVLFKQRLYEAYGNNKEVAKETAINEFVNKEVMYQIAINNGISISDKVLTSYINQQIEAAREVKTSYLYYLKNITVEEAYNHEKNNIYKDLCIEKYRTKLERKYGLSKSTEVFNTQIEDFKKNNKIDVLI
ncbi:MAG: hypothetical protein U0L17_06570 [Acutalibacteraceae bacterium]|nr:hypothetical protein [Acutalibacteraceae bacterium]